MCAKQMKSGTDAYLLQVREIVAEVLAPHPVRVYLFGSRATGGGRRLSDVDIAIEPSGPVPQDLLPRLRETLEESTVPYHVDVIDLSTVDSAFRTRVKKEGVLWSDCGKG